MRRVKRTSDIDPDVISIAVDWARFTVGASMFIPCINTREARRQVKRLAKKMDLTIESRVRIESEKLGIRVWRLA